MFSFSPFLGLSFVHSFIKLINISIAKDVFLKYSQQQFRHLLTRLIPPLSLSLALFLFKSLQELVNFTNLAHEPRSNTTDYTVQQLTACGITSSWVMTGWMLFYSGIALSPASLGFRRWTPRLGARSPNCPTVRRSSSTGRRPPSGRESERLKGKCCSHLWNLALFCGTGQWSCTNRKVLVWKHWFFERQTDQKNLN